MPKKSHPASPAAEPRIDPDPFTIAVGIAGILGGLASTIGSYRALFPGPNQSLSKRRKLRTSLGEVDDLLRYLDTDVRILRDIITRADLGNDRRFRLGSRAFLTAEDFDRYAQVTDNIYNRLRKLLSAMHSIERTVTFIDPFPGYEPIAEIDDVRGMVLRLLRDEDQTIEEAFAGLATVLEMIRRMVLELERAAML